MASVHSLVMRLTKRGQDLGEDQAVYRVLGHCDSLGHVAGVGRQPGNHGPGLGAVLAVGHHAHRGVGRVDRELQRSSRRPRSRWPCGSRRRGRSGSSSGCRAAPRPRTSRRRARGRPARGARAAAGRSRGPGAGPRRGTPPRPRRPAPRRSARPRSSRPASSSTNATRSSWSTWVNRCDVPVGQRGHRAEEAEVLRLVGDPAVEVDQQLGVVGPDRPDVRGPPVAQQDVGLPVPGSLRRFLLGRRAVHARRIYPDVKDAHVNRWCTGGVPGAEPLGAAGENAPMARRTTKQPLPDDFEEHILDTDIERRDASRRSWSTPTPSSTPARCPTPATGSSRCSAGSSTR